MSSHLRLLSSRCALVGCATFLAAAPLWASPITIQPGDGKDTQLASGPLANTHFGSAEDVVANWSGNLRSIGLIEFDLSAYIGSSASSATLSLFHVTNGTNGTTYSVFRVTSAWNEGAATFNTAPAFDPIAVASLTIGDDSSGLYRDWNVTSVVNGWLAGTYSNYGFWIEETPVQGGGVAYFASSDWGSSATDPRLQLDLNQVPEPATLLLLGSGLFAAAFARRRFTKR